MSVIWIKPRNKKSVSPFNFVPRKAVVRWFPHGLVIPASLIGEGVSGFIIGIDNEKLKMYLKPSTPRDQFNKEAYKLYMYNNDSNWFINTSTLTKNFNKELGVEFNPKGGRNYPVDIQSDGMLVVDISEVVKTSKVYQDYKSSVENSKKYAYNR